jgi:hypothetical protein
MLEVSVTTLGPLALASPEPLESASEMSSVLHFEKESCAVAVPVPTDTPKLLLGFFGFREPLNVTV